MKVFLFLGLTLLSLRALAIDAKSKSDNGIFDSSCKIITKLDEKTLNRFLGTYRGRYLVQKDNHWVEHNFTGTSSFDYDLTVDRQRSGARAGELIAHHTTIDDGPNGNTKYLNIKNDYLEFTQTTLTFRFYLCEDGRIQSFGDQKRPANAFNGRALFTRYPSAH